MNTNTALAADHVLIMTIGAYPNIRQLDGVAYDGKNALELANTLGYQTNNAQIYKEVQLAGDGIQRAVESTLSKVQKGDRLFLYYSGHGASFPVAGGCAEALVPFDATSDTSRFVPTSALLEQINKARPLLTDAFVFFDACHAGGHREIVVSRGKGISKDELVTSKSYVPRSGAVCLQAANANTSKSAFQTYVDEIEPPQKGVTARGMSKTQLRNFTFVAAARENEEALDQKGKGGLATTALLQCAKQGVSSARGTGVVNVNELRECAQEIINKTVPQITNTHKAHNIEVYANGYKTLASVPVLSSVSSNTILDEATRTINVFEQITLNSNSNLGFTAQFKDNRVALSNSTKLTYGSNFGGYLTIFYVGSDKKEIIDLIANEPIKPASNAGNWDVQITKPVGENAFLLLLTQEKLDTAKILETIKSGQSVNLSASVAQNLACALEGQRNARISINSKANECNTRNAIMSGKSKTETGNNSNTVFAGYGAVFLQVNGY